MLRSAAAGIIWTKTGPVAVVVLTAKNTDTKWTPDNAGNVLCANAAYDHFERKR